MQPPQDIQLRGLGIANEHCIIEIVEKEIFITPMKGAKLVPHHLPCVSDQFSDIFLFSCLLFSPSRTLVNGQAVTEKSPLRHGARILLGNNHLFRLSCPGQQREGDEPMDYEQAMKEISLNELTNGEECELCNLTFCCCRFLTSLFLTSSPPPSLSPLLSPPSCSSPILPPLPSNIRPHVHQDAEEPHGET